MEPLLGKREHESGPDTPDIVPDIIRKADPACGNDNRIPSAVRTAHALIQRISSATARPAQGPGLPYSTKVPFHFAAAAVIVSRAAVANGL